MKTQTDTKHRKKIILGIDASRSLHLKPTGVERYSTEIISSLLKLTPSDEIRLYTPHVLSCFPKKDQIVIPFPRFWTLLRLSFELLLHPPDVLFVPAHVLPFFAPRKSFVMIHDIAFEKIPEAYSRFQRIHLRWSTRRALKKCTRVLVPSSAVKDDLEHYYGANPERVLVVPHGPLPLTIPKKTSAHERASELTKEPVFFYLGRLEAKKNLLTVAKAFEMVRKKHPNARLILAGRPGFGWESTAKALQGIQGLEFPGFLSEEAVVRTFLSSIAFVFPSLEEGFGFPILQAFQAKCPVLASELPVLKEVAKDAALFVPPMDTQGFAEAMLTLIEDPSLSQALVLKGWQRLHDFSWDKAGRTLADLFHTA